MNGRGSGSDRGQRRCRACRHLDVEEHDVGRASRRSRPRASSASPASPTTSTSPASASSCRSRARAGGSSSTSKARITPAPRAVPARRQASGITSGSSMRATVRPRARRAPARATRARRSGRAADRGRCAGRSSRRPARELAASARAGPGPLSRTSRVRRSPSTRAISRCVPGPRTCAMPCLTAFSTSVCSSIDGTCARPARGGVNRERRRRAEARLLDVEVGRARRPAPDRAAPIPARNGAACSGTLRRAARRRASARAGSVWMSEAIAFSALKRKCGLICARSAFSSERLVCSAQLLRDQILFLPALLQPHVLQHVAEDAAERAEQRQVLAEQQPFARHRRNADPQRGIGGRAGDLEGDAHVGLVGRRRAQPHRDVEHVLQAGFGGGEQRGLVGGGLHRREHRGHRRHRRVVAAEPGAIERPAQRSRQPRRGQQQRHDGERVEPGPRGALGQPVEPAAAAARTPRRAARTPASSSAPRLTTRS